MILNEVNIFDISMIGLENYWLHASDVNTSYVIHCFSVYKQLLQAFDIRSCIYKYSDSVYSIFLQETYHILYIFSIFRDMKESNVLFYCFGFQSSIMLYENVASKEERTVTEKCRKSSQ